MFGTCQRVDTPRSWLTASSANSTRFINDFDCFNIVPYMWPWNSLIQRPSDNPSPSSFHFKHAVFVLLHDVTKGPCFFSSSKHVEHPTRHHKTLLQWQAATRRLNILCCLDISLCAAATLHSGMKTKDLSVGIICDHFKLLNVLQIVPPPPPVINGDDNDIWSLVSSVFS